MSDVDKGLDHDTPMKVNVWLTRRVFWFRVSEVGPHSTLLYS